MALIRKPLALSKRVEDTAPITKAPVAPKPLQSSAKATAKPTVKETVAPVTTSAPATQKVTEVAKEGTLSVRKTVIDPTGTTVADVDTELKIEARVFATQPAIVTYGAGVKKSDNNYGNSTVHITLSVPCYTEELLSVFDDVRAKVHTLLDQDAELLGINDESEPAIAAVEDTEVAADTDTEEAPAEDGEITEADINAMSKSALVALVKEYGLGIDEKLGIKDLRKAIIAVMNEAEDEDAVAEDAAAAEDDVVVTDDDAEEGEEITAEEINSMTKDELIALAEENAIAINPKGSEAAIRKSIFDALGGDEVADAGVDEDEDEAPVEAEDDTYLDEAALAAYSINELKELANSNGITVKLKLGAKEGDVRKAYTKAIIDFQDSHEA